MKKALIVLLLLAFVAGGLFAQFSFSGRVDSGLAIFKYADVDDLTFGSISRQLDAGGTRAEINANITNEAGNAGLSFRLRVMGATFSALNYRWAYGWIKGFDGLLEARGGRIQGSDFDTLDALSDGDTLYDSYGLQFYVTPLDMFKVGLGAYTTSYLGSGDLAKDAFTGWFGFGVYVADILDFVAQMRFGRDLFDAYASFSVTAIQNVDILFTAGLFNLLDPEYAVGATAATDGHWQYPDGPAWAPVWVPAAAATPGTLKKDGVDMYFYEQFGYGGIENLGLNLGLVQSISTADSADLYFRGVIWLTYAMGSITPRLDLNFVTGGGYNVGSFYFTGQSSDPDDGSPFMPTYDKDNMYMTLIPSVQFQVARNCFLDVGFVAGIDMSKNDKVAFVGADKKGFNFGAFLDLYVRF